VSQFALNTDGFVRTRLALELTDLAGNLIATTTVDVPSSGQRSMFVDEVFDPSQFPASGKAILRVETTTANTAIAMIGLRSRVNGRGDVLITTTPPVNESSTPLGSAVFFPHLVDGGGWSTQAVLFSGAIAQAGAGTMSFFGPDGQPFPIPLQ
jgi:hypothetical protein